MIVQWIGTQQITFVSAWKLNFWRLIRVKKTKRYGRKLRKEDSSGRRSNFGWVWQTEEGKDSGSTSQQAGYLYLYFCSQWTLIVILWMFLQRPGFTYWDLFQPEPNSIEDCAYIKTNSKWNDWNCRSSRWAFWTINALCEKKWSLIKKLPWRKRYLGVLMCYIMIHFPLNWINVDY